MKKAVFGFVAVVLGLVLAEAAVRVLFALRPALEKKRQYLLGAQNPYESFQFSLAQAYLHYIPIPNFAHNGILDHNGQGYRGRAVRLDKAPGTLRVICLGGSTTYGWGVDDPAKTYPAYLEGLLAQRPVPGFDRVEVVNAGIPWGTTAEILTHYHFKFHYFRPDLVVLNVGSNDAQGLTLPYFHPDYSHWRKPIAEPRAFSPAGRFLLRSRLFALAEIGVLLAEPNPDSARFVSLDERPPAAVWYERTAGGYADVPMDERGFQHNLEALLDEFARDGVRVVLVPFRAAPQNRYGPPLHRFMGEEEAVLRKLAAERQAVFAPFPIDVISPGNWLDDCHQNPAGNLEKARYLEPFVRRALADPARGAP